MKPTAIIDIGSSKVVCLCGSRTGIDGVVVHGAGVAPCIGFRDGDFPDKESLHNAIVEALKKAEQESRVRIRDVAVTVPLSFSKLVSADATIALGQSTKVSAKDVDELINAAYSKCPKLPGYTLMHSTPVFFLVDGVSSSERPDGIETDELAGLISFMFVREDYLAIVQEALDDLGVEISMCVSAQQAESVMLIPDKDRVRPSVLLDIGYYQTDICVVENEAVTGMTTVPIGGFHFASDLSFGLDVPMEAAEQAKRRFVFSLENDDRTEVIRTATGTKKVSRAAVSFIIEARANEFCGILRREIEKLGINLDAKPVIYVSGGGLLMMRGGLEYLRGALGLTLKRDMPWTPRLSTPNYCSAFGALDFVIKNNETAVQQTVESTESVAQSSWLKKIKDFFMK